MARIVDESTPTDMLVLWVVETVACCAGLYAAFTYARSQAHAIALFPATTPEVIDNAVMLSLLLGLLCFVLGLYRVDVIVRTRSLLLTACLAALASVPVVWAASAVGLIDSWAMLGSKRAWLAELMLVWIGLLVSTRLAYVIALRSGIIMRKAFLTETSAAQAFAGAVRAATGGAIDVALPRVTPGGLGMAAAGGTASGGGGAGGRIAGWLQGPADLIDAPDFGEAQFGEAKFGEAKFGEAKFGEAKSGRINLSTLASRPEDVALMQAAALDGHFACAIRRCIDVVTATFLLVLTLPVMAFTALAVAVESPGPVIYRQVRTGRGGQPFVILKFRSMRDDAERGVAMFASKNDPRVTRVGRIIRLLRIDELPQLINVLRGDMGMVGPRPERPDFVQRYEANIPFYSLRTLVRPGVTGWAQVKAPYTASEAETREKLSFDLYYLKNRSLRFDFMVMLATVRVILFRIGAR